MYYKKKQPYYIKKINIYIQNIYVWIICGFSITSITSWFLSKNYKILKFIFLNKKILFLITLSEILISLILANMINKLKNNTIISLFLMYTMLNGVILSSIFLIYTLKSIIILILFIIINFILMNIIGLKYKNDLTNLGEISSMLLINIVISNILNSWTQNIYISHFISYINAILFSLIMIWDIQKITKFSKNIILTEYSSSFIKNSILSSFSIYLNLFNLFLIFLEIFGKKFTYFFY